MMNMLRDMQTEIKLMSRQLNRLDIDIQEIKKQLAENKNGADINAKILHKA